MRENIIEAAINEFSVHGLKFKMNDVAKSLGMSKKTLYEVFASKEALLEAIADKYFADFMALKNQVDNDDSMDVTKKIEKVLCALPERYQNIGLSNMYELKAKYPKIYKRLMGYVSQGWDSVEQYLRQGIEEKKIRDISIPVVMTIIKGTVSELMQDRVLVENAITYEQAKKELVSVIIDGVRYDTGNAEK